VLDQQDPDDHWSPDQRCLDKLLLVFYWYPL
jgi:hypothetical protein